MANPVALPGLNDANPVRQNTAIRQISERLEADYAPLASPVFTGDPQAPTPALADNDTSIATTAYVQGQNYTTKTYVDGANATQDTAIAGKAATVHTHAQSDVTGLVSALAGKEPSITASGNATDYWGGDKAFHAAPAQKLIGAYSAKFTTNTTTTSQISVSGGAPTTSVGLQIISFPVTLTTATQRIDFTAALSAYTTTTGPSVAAVFAGSTCIGSFYQNTTAGVADGFSFVGTYTPGAAGTYTITMRVGPHNPTTLTINAFTMGGTICTGLNVSVIEP